MPAEGVPVVFGRLILICDKAMRTAAMLIASRQPEDSAAITRRAIEAAKIALAIKLNDANAMKWVAGAERLERWAARQSNEKPRHLQVRLVDISGDPLMDDLNKFWGVLSDAYVHFTPEFYSSLAWETHVDSSGESGQVFLNYFHTNEREIERHYALLAAVHSVILKAFDQCVDGRITGNVECAASLNAFQKIGHDLNLDYQRKYLEPALPETQWNNVS